MLGDLVSDYAVEVVYDFTPQFVNYIVNLYDKRSKEIKELNHNYTAERIRDCFERGRFKHGFYIVKMQNEVIATFGVDDFKGWAVLTRYLGHKRDKWLFFAGVIYTAVQKELKGKVIGICHTQNKSSRKMYDTVADRVISRCKNKSYGPQTSIGASAECLKKTKILDYDVMYRGTVQEVVTYDTDLIPPFEKYSSSL